MKDIKTKEVTTKPKTKNPASRIPKELMRTAILESKEKSQTIANARDNDMGEQSPSEYASGKVASAEEWAARKSGRTVTSAGKTAAQTSYEKIKLRVTGKKEAEKEAARGTGDTQAPDPVSREAPEQKNREQTSENVKIKSREAQEAQIKDVQIQKAKRQKAVSDAIKTKEQKIRVARETPRIQNGQELSGTKQFSIRDQSRKKAVADTARQNAICQKQPETIRIKEKPRKQLEPKTIQRRTIKTAPPSAKISIQPEQKLRVASSNALTTRMQKQMERRAAKQAAKKAALQTSDGIRRIQKTARAGENTFKAARAAVEGSENRAVHDSCTGSRRSGHGSASGYHGRDHWRCGILWKLREQRSTQPGSTFLYGNHPEIRQPVWNPRIRFRDTGNHDAGIWRPGDRSHAEQ